MPIATVVVYFTDRTLRAPPVTFGYGAAAAIMLLGAIIFLPRGVADGQASVLVPIAQMVFRQPVRFLQLLKRTVFSVRRNRPYVQTGTRTPRRTIRSEHSARTDAQTILVQR
jgi:hypothetical protein